MKQISLVDKNELEKLNSSNRVLTLQYDFEVAKREHCERQLARLQDNLKQLQSELSYMDEKVKRADDQMKLADRLNRDNKDECEILQLRIMDLEKRLNLTEKDKDIIEQELLIVKQKMEATTYRMQRYNEALVNADNDLDPLSDNRYVIEARTKHHSMGLVRLVLAKTLPVSTAWKRFRWRAAILNPPDLKVKSNTENPPDIHWFELLACRYFTLMCSFEHVCVCVCVHLLI